MKSLIEQIITRAQQSPDKFAIRGEGINVTYKTLIELSYSYAEGLKNINDNWIGVNSNFGWKAYAGILGCWMAGKGYVPLNFEFPETRVNNIIKQANIQYCIGPSTLKPVVETTNAKPIIESGEDAYLLFTSGTTGVPKGVPITQENLLVFAQHYLKHDCIKFTKEDIFLQSYELTFDVSVFCFLMPFLVGGTLILPPSANSKQLGLFKAITNYNVTVTSFVPSVVRLTLDFLPRIKFPSIRYAFFSGEALYGKWAKTWMNSVPNAIVYNCYGPTETVIVCTEENLNELEEQYFHNGLPLPLGKHFEGIELCLEDGEIVYAGKQTFKGYLNQSKIQKYYSGDLAHYDVNGKLMFDGRKDNQVQWNGHRIELEEIENKLLNKNISICKAIFTLNQLHIFCNLQEQQVTKIYQSIFPEYYLPKKFHYIPTLPINVNGKHDIEQLKKIIFEKNS